MFSIEIQNDEYDALKSLIRHVDGAEVLDTDDWLLVCDLMEKLEDQYQESKRK